MNLSDIDVFILAGGYGKRISSVVSTPKFLAPIAGRPFCDHLFDRLRDAGFRRVVLGLAYRAPDVLAHLKGRQEDALRIITIQEPEPTGMEAATLAALPHIQSDPFFVMNGDTICNLDFGGMLAKYGRWADTCNLSAVVCGADGSIVNAGVMLRSVSTEPRSTNFYPCRGFIDIGTPQSYQRVKDGFPA